MDETEIAETKVVPFLTGSLNWPETLISKYGRVPVQTGSTTVWADLVCYIWQYHKMTPWILVEVKRRNTKLEEAISQAESYSLILGSPFFCVTDGRVHQFYATGESQGNSIRLDDAPPIPSSEYLPENVDRIVFPPIIDSLVDLFLKELKINKKLYDDTDGHNECAKKLQKDVFSHLDSLTKKGLKNTFDKNLMLKNPNKRQIFRQIDDDFDRVIKMLECIRDLRGDPVKTIDRLLDWKGGLRLKGGGIFFISQLLAGAHRNEFVILEEGISRALSDLKITDIFVKNDTANGYVYVNEICKKLHQEKLEKRLKKKGLDFGLAAVHNFLWHYYKRYKSKGEWW
jgi:hypothetical protein